MKSMSKNSTKLFSSTEKNWWKSSQENIVEIIIAISIVILVWLSIYILKVYTIYNSSENSNNPVVSKCDICINTNPSGAYVSLDDEIIGSTPFNRQIEKGKHIIGLFIPGYLGIKYYVNPDDTNINIDYDFLPNTGVTNGHEWVDLGLSVRWATCNIGAKDQYSFGNYYAWGQVDSNNNQFNEDTFTGQQGGYCLHPQYDAAAHNWGGGWRLPTASEFQELVDKCTWIWQEDGYYVQAVGNQIFLPAAGYRGFKSIMGTKRTGNYWTSSMYEGSLWGKSYCHFNFEKKEKELDWWHWDLVPISLQFAIRPVIDK